MNITDDLIRAGAEAFVLLVTQLDRQNFDLTVDDLDADDIDDVFPFMAEALGHVLDLSGDDSLSLNTGLKADAWDEGAEAATEHYAAHAYDPNGNGPADPPSNPYRKFKHGKWVLA